MEINEMDKDCECLKPGKDLGRNVRHIREMLCMKQQTLAEKMGVTQQAVSKIENKADIDSKTLENIAKALEVPVALIENFNLDEIVYNIQNNYESGNSPFSQNNPTINSLDVIRMTIQAHKEVYDSIIEEKNKEITGLKEQVRQLNQDYIVYLKEKKK